MTKYVVSEIRGFQTVDFDVDGTTVSLARLRNTELVYSMALDGREKGIRILYDKNTSNVFIRVKEVSRIVGFEIKSTFQSYRQKHKNFSNSLVSKSLNEIRYSDEHRVTGNPSMLAVVFTKDTVDSVFVPSLVTKIGDRLDFVKKIIDIYFRANEIFDEALAELAPPVEPEVIPNPIEDAASESTVNVEDTVEADASVSNEGLSKVLTNGFNVLADAMQKQTEMLRQISGYGSVADSKDSSEASRKAEELSKAMTEISVLKNDILKAEALNARYEKKAKDLQTKYDCLMEEHIKTVQELGEANLEIKNLKGQNSVPEKPVAKPATKPVEKTTPKKKEDKSDPSKEYITNLSTTDGEEITYKEWRKNTLSPLTEYGYSQDKGTVTAILTRAYKILTAQYGIVWCELRKEYGDEAKSTLEKMYYYETCNAGQRGLLKGVINTMLKEEAEDKVTNKYHVEYVSDINESLRVLSEDTKIDLIKLRNEFNSILLKDKTVHWGEVSREYREKNKMKSNVVLNPINVIAQSELSAVKLRTVSAYNEFTRKKITG